MANVTVGRCCLLLCKKPSGMGRDRYLHSFLWLTAAAGVAISPKIWSRCVRWDCAVLYSSRPLENEWVRVYLKSHSLQSDKRASLFLAVNWAVVAITALVLSVWIPSKPGHLVGPGAIRPGPRRGPRARPQLAPGQGDPWKCPLCNKVREIHWDSHRHLPPVQWWCHLEERGWSKL